MKSFKLSLYVLYYAFVLTHFSFLLHLHEASWSSRSALSESPHFFSDSFSANPLSHLYLLDTACSVHRARQCWTQAPSISWLGVFSSEAEGLNELGNPFRFGSKDGDCQLLFLWPCHSWPPGHKTGESDKRIKPTGFYFLMVMSII